MQKPLWRLPTSVVMSTALTLSCAHQPQNPLKNTTVSAEGDASPLTFAASTMLPSGVWGHPMMTWDPDNIREGSKVHLFFASLFCKRDGSWYFSWNPAEPAACSIDEVFFSIGYAFKDEAVSDEFTFRPTPLMAPGVAGAWDDDQIETPEVIRQGSKVLLFYSSMPKNTVVPKQKSARYQIGVATIDLADHNSASLEDLLLNDVQLRFQRHPANPIVPRSKLLTRFDRENTQEPSVIYRDGRFELFYLGIRADKRGTNLPLADDEPLLDTTADYRELGLGRICLDDHLERQACPLDDGPIMTMKYLASGPEGTLINMPNVYWHDNLYHLFYTAEGDGGDNHKGQQIFYRNSPDLVHWTPARLVISGGENAEDNWAVHSPAVALVETPQGPLFEMVYQAWGVAARGEGNLYCVNFRFRLATDTDPLLCNSMAFGFTRQLLAQ